MFGRRKKVPFYDEGRSQEVADYLALQLDRLMALPLTTIGEVKKWYEESNAVQNVLKERFPDFSPFHETWHFFADADIRARDHSYSEYQHRLMTDYVKNLRAKKSNPETF
jgi:hypothetical protein